MVERRAVRLLWVVGLLCASMFSLTVLPQAYAVGGAHIIDNANLFSPTNETQIGQTAMQANLPVVVVTSNQSFPTQAAWDAYLRSQGSDPTSVIVGFNVPRHHITVLRGPQSGVSAAVGSQSINDARPLISSGHPGAAVVRMIQDYRPNASYSVNVPNNTTVYQPVQHQSGGFPFGWLIFLIAIAGIVALVLRALRNRGGFGPMMGGGIGGGPYNSGPGYGPGGPGFGGYGQGPGFGAGGGGGFGRGILGGVLGGLGGAFIGNELFGRRDVDAADPSTMMNNPMDTPPDTPADQNLGGDWSGDVGSWGGDSGGGGGGGDWGSSDSGSW